MRKAEEIAKTSDPYKIELILGGQKTQNFFWNLLEPHVEHGVTIDVWALRAVGEHRESAHPALYDRVERMYTLAAHECGILPHQAQAVLWVNEKIN